MPERVASLVRTTAPLLAFWLGLSLLVNLPPYQWALFGPFHWALALEVGVVLAVLAAVQAFAGRVPRPVLHALAAIIVFLIALRAADLVARTMVDRPLNVFLDVTLLPAVAHVTTVMLGRAPALLAFAGLIVALAALHFALVWTFARLSRGFARPAARRVFAGLAVAAFAVFTAQRLVAVDWTWRPVSGAASLAVAQQVERLGATLARRSAFRADLAFDPAAAIPEGALFSRLAGSDVFVVFIESYGVSAVDDPRYGALVLPRLEAFGARIAAAGLSVSSGRLVAATAGGQSWLNHATLTSGRWIDDQTLYSLFLAERPRALAHDFKRAGWRTVQLMPAITLPWPEGLLLGYDATWVAAQMGYHGPNFYWGVVPDQFALDFFARRELEVAPRPPVFAVLALISSHAPWLPVPEVVGWDELGDGSVYERWTVGAPEPREVWRDPEAVRDQYARSIAHSIDAVAAFLAERLPSSALVLVLGDHQPAPIITGREASRAVPVHVVSHDPTLLEPFAALGFVSGVRPAAPPESGDAGLASIGALREFLLHAYTGIEQGRGGADLPPS